MSEKQMGSSISTNSWSSTYEEIKAKHDLAYASIDQAISLEEQEKPQEAIEKYKEGIQYIDEALRIQVTCPEHPDFSWEKARVMIQKMKKTRAEVLMRINSIQSLPTFVPAEVEPPPSYQEAVSLTSSSSTDETPRTYKDLANALNDLKIDQNSEMEAEIVYIYEGVKLYFISPDGEVSSSSDPQTMKIILVEDDGTGAPRAILQVGDWVYPLIPGVSPCYRTDYGAFILPNVYAEMPGSSIGLILPPDTDSDVYDLLENILYGIVGQYVPPREELPPEEDLSSKISSGIVNGAWFLSQGLIRGAESVGNFLNNSTPVLMNHIQSSEKPSEVPPKVAKGVQIAETATNKAAQVTGYIADQVGVATMKLGQFLAPHIQKQGTRLLASGFKMPEREASAKVAGVLTVAAGAVEGLSTVYRGLENSASILGHSLRDNTVKVVKHKYGHPAGAVTGDAFNTVGNVIHISHNTTVITPKGLVKRAAKDAGKAVVYEYRNTRINDGASTSRQNGFVTVPNQSLATNNVASKKVEELSVTKEKK